MAIGPITIVPDERLADALEKVAAQTNRTPEEVALQALAEFLDRQADVEIESQAGVPPKGLTEAGKRALAKLEAGESLTLQDIAGAFSSGRRHNDAERLEEILEEEWLRDDY
jgi:predicted transcriptional regulator